MAKGFRTNVSYKQYETQIKDIVPYAFGRTVVPDAGYEAMTAVNLQDVDYGYLPNQYGRTAVIGLQEVIPIIEDGVYTESPYVDSINMTCSFDSSSNYLKLRTGTDLGHYGLQVYTTQSLPDLRYYTIANGKITVNFKNITAKSFYINGIDMQVEGNSPVTLSNWSRLFYIDSSSQSSVSFSTDKIIRFSSRPDVNAKLEISQQVSTQFGANGNYKACFGIANLYILTV